MNTLEHRDRLNTDSSTSRERFIKKLAAKLGIERDVLASLIDTQFTKLADEIDEKNPAPAGQGEDEAQSQATLAANMAADWELWQTPSKEAYATIVFDDHKENWPVRSQTFKRFVAKQFFDEQGKAMNSEALAAAVNLLEAKALFEGDEHLVHVRVAEHDGNIYLDLCNSDWQVVQVVPRGWGVFVNHAIVERATNPAPVGWPFIYRYVFPDSELLPVTTSLRIGEMAGFEIRDLECLREHYALTLRHWSRRLEERAEEARRLTDDFTYRVFRLYLAGSAFGFEIGQPSIYQAVFVKLDNGQSRLPLTRADWYA